MPSLRDKLIARLAQLGVEHRPLPGRDDGFASLCYGGKSFAHFHNDRELDIRLTRAIIERERLEHPQGSSVHPNRTRTSPWLEVRFAKSTDLDHVVHLVKLAISKI